MSIIVIIIVAISLSMDAFSLSLVYGTLGLEPKKEHLISFSVGIFHFFMPIFGVVLGGCLRQIIVFNPDIITGLIFIFLSCEMLISLKKDNEVIELSNMTSILLFDLAVSIDSFLVGINLGISNANIILSSTIFMLISASFTYLGLKLGKRINIMIGNISTIIGSIILIILGLFYLK